MHILIVTHPRSRSSFLCDAFSKHYQCTNFHELFDFTNPLNHEITKAKLLKNLSEKVIMEKHVTYLQECTKQIFHENSGSVKLFPRHILNTFLESNNYQYSIQDLNNINFQVVPKFDKILEILKFDKIIFLNRDIINSALSYVLNIHIVKAPLLQNELDKIYFHKKISNIEIKPEYYKHLNFFIFEYILYSHIKKYIQSTVSCDSIELNYNNCVEYVQTNLTGDIKSQFVETSLDYTKIISNYTEIRNYIINVHQQLLEYKFVL